MKILWLVNIIMPELALHLGKNPTVFGGWLSGAMKAVKECGYELVICTTVSDVYETKKYSVNDVTYYISKRSTVSEMEEAFKRILDEENPDVIHIYGTEFEHSWALAKQTDPDKTIVSIQGLVSFYARHVNGGVPDTIANDNLMHKLLRKMHKGGMSIELQKQSFLQRSEYEIQTLKQVHYVNGGTQWGDGCAKLLQPDVNLLQCGLILRESFYRLEKWDIAKIKRHSIFTVYTYPIKGFDMFLQALKFVVEQYPDTIVYVAGNICKYRNYTGIKKRIMDAAPDYDWYIQSLIERYHLQNHLKFEGYLDEQSMRNRELHSHVFVSASAIENHSTALGEAMITGVPSIASCVGGLQEMINHGEDGFLYPFNEPYMLAYYICEIFKNDGLAAKLSQAGINHATETYDRQKNKTALLGMYKAVAGN